MKISKNDLISKKKIRASGTCETGFKGWKLYATGREETMKKEKNWTDY